LEVGIIKEVNALPKASYRN